MDTGLTSALVLAVFGTGLYGLVFGVTRLLRNRRWRRDAHSNLTLSLARCDGNTGPGPLAGTDAGTAAGGTDAGTTGTTDATGTGDVGTYLRRYRAGNGAARPRTVHRDHVGPGVVLGRAHGDPRVTDAPPVVGAP